MANYCPICQATVLDEGMCECCKLALDRLVKKRMGEREGGKSPTKWTMMNILAYVLIANVN